MTLNHASSTNVVQSDMKQGFPSAKSVLVSSKLMRHWAKKAKESKRIRELAGNHTFFMPDASVLDALTANRSHNVFDVESKEDFFFENNQNAENQTGACFDRSKDIFRTRATASLEMILKTCVTRRSNFCHF
jgi:hypothetical protein